MRFTPNPRREQALADLAKANDALDSADRAARTARSLPERAAAAGRKEQALADRVAAQQRVTEEHQAELRRHG